MNFQRWCVAVCIALFMAGHANAVVLFSDDFNTAASLSNYVKVVTSTDTAATSAFEYSALGIPAAPNTTDASTLGLKLEANNGAPASFEAITLHTNQQFSGAYVVKFDAWINANGPFPGGGAGSTEMLTAGVGGDGTTVNGSTTASSAQIGSGGWTAVTGENGAARDFRLHKNGTEQTLASNQYLAGNTGNAQDHANAYYATDFPAIDVAALPVQGANNDPNPGSYTQQTGTIAAGVVGFRWHTVKLTVNPTGGTGGAALMTWTIDSLDIGKLDAGGTGGTFNTNGRATIGFWDPFGTSITDNPALSFGLVDNLSVSSVDAAINADFNGDLEVNAADYVLWRDHNPTVSGASKSTGDSDGDGDVDATDYNNWKATFGNAAPPASGATIGGSAVPEPTTCVLALGSVMLLTTRRRSRIR